ncbi:phosphoribosylaminoimidazolesuccinocarboxamide synthase, partial [Candidatus Kapabacteria bacterium]|nr:phosphoribosylaminoimidazolesuccinocarboxamide synthase [Candidatus Kapabacteria bacterium]
MTVFESNLQDLKLVSKGKVREIYEFDSNTYLFVASDRISAFDVVMQEAIPQKGVILNKVANYWLNTTKHIIANHLVDESPENKPKLKKYHDQLKGRSILVNKCTTLPIEFIVRGYLAGSAWVEYQKSNTICGIPIKAGLSKYSELPEPILTPSTKAETGHDVNISPSEME